MLEGSSRERLFSRAQRWSLFAGIGGGVASVVEEGEGRRKGREPVGEAWLVEGVVVKGMELKRR